MSSSLHHSRPSRIARASHALQTFASHWTVTLSGWLLAVVMTVLYFVDAGRTDLAYSESPSRTTIVTSNAVDGLRVSFNGADVRGGVSGVQFLVWNRGNRAIKREDILEAVRLVPDRLIHVLSVRVERPSRSAIQFGCYRPTPKGEVELSWKILERGDAAVVDVIYAGPRHAKFTLAGAVIGQAEPRRRPYGSWAAPDWTFYLEKLWPTAVLLIQALASRPRSMSRRLSLLAASVLAITGLWSLGSEWLFAAAPKVRF